MATSTSSTPVPQGESRMVGFITFATVMMILIGGFEVIMGFVALFDSDYYPVGDEGLIVTGEYTAWGWTHIILGTLIVATGFGLALGQMWARIVGIGLTFICAVVNLGFIGAAPIWSLTVITLCVLVIYAIAVHGGENAW